MLAVLVWTTAAVVGITQLRLVHSLRGVNPFYRHHLISNFHERSIKLHAVSSHVESRTTLSRENTIGPQSDSDVQDDFSTEIVLDYDGPISDFSLMEAGCVIEDLGLEVLIGQSTVPNAGRGLFIALQEGVEEVTLPRGTPICGYSKGTFTDEGEGDKTVAYAFQSMYTGVIYNKQITSLKKLVQSMRNTTEDVSVLIDGHLVFFDDETQELCITPTDNYPNRYFIPFEVQEWSPASFGTQANDLGYQPELDNIDDYIENSVKHNILQIVWRMEFTEGRFIPTWPVVILNRDIRFTNVFPMEVGIHYSWNYWSAFRANTQSNPMIEKEM